MGPPYPRAAKGGGVEAGRGDTAASWCGSDGQRHGDSERVVATGEKMDNLQITPLPALKIIANRSSCILTI